MSTAKPATTPTADSTVREHTAPMSSRAVAASLVATFIVGGLVAGVVPLWALVLIGIVVGVVALYGMDRYGRSRGR
jgi:hypothetical protein